MSFAQWLTQLVKFEKSCFNLLVQPLNPWGFVPYAVVKVIYLTHQPRRPLFTTRVVKMKMFSK